MRGENPGEKKEVSSAEKRKRTDSAVTTVPRGWSKLFSTEPEGDNLIFETSSVLKISLAIHTLHHH